MIDIPFPSKPTAQRHFIYTHGVNYKRSMCKSISQGVPVICMLDQISFCKLYLKISLYKFLSKDG